MPEGLVTAGGEAVELDDTERAFAAAMAAPPSDDGKHEAPPRKDPDAPYGRKEDGTPKKSAGRPRTAAARVTGGPAKAKSAKAPAVPKDYTEELTGVCQLAYAITANLAPADAAAIADHGPAMVQAWAKAAQENRQVARGIEWLTSGGVWGAVVATTLPFALQIARNHGAALPAAVAGFTTDPETLTARTNADLAAAAEAQQEAA